MMVGSGHHLGVHMKYEQPLMCIQDVPKYLGTLDENVILGYPLHRQCAKSI